MATKKLTLKQKVALYESALHSIAAWGESDNPSMRDEPGSSEEARKTLKEAGVSPPI